MRAFALRFRRLALVGTTFSALIACGGDGGSLTGRRGPGRSADQPATSDSSDVTGSEATDGPVDPTRAYLHVDAWSIWWNDRTRCGSERTFLEICQRRREKDCGDYQKAYDACDERKVVYGQVGPEKQGERLCQRGPFPDIGGCDARKYDFDALRYSFYGAEWQGNWPIATVKIFEAGGGPTGDALVAISNHPERTEASMAGTKNHGIGHGCALDNATSGDEAYQQPFGAFAWVEVPTDRPVSVYVAAGSNFAGREFAGCSRGAASQSPWVTSPPGADRGCVYETTMQFEAGKTYLSRYGIIREQPRSGPPQPMVDAFSHARTPQDVASPDACPLN